MYSRLHRFFLILILEKKIKRLISEQKWLPFVSLIFPKSEKSILRFFTFYEAKVLQRNKDAVTLRVHKRVVDE